MPSCDILDDPTSFQINLSNYYDTNLVSLSLCCV